MNGARRRRDARARSRRRGGEGRPHRHAARPRSTRRSSTPYGRLGPRMRHVRGNHDAMRDPEMAGRARRYAIEHDGVTLAVLDTVVPGRDRRCARRRAASAGSTTSHPVPTDPVLVFGHHPAFNHDPNYGLTSDDHARAARRVRAAREHRRLLRRAHALATTSCATLGSRRAVRRDRVRQGLPGRVGRVPRLRRRLHPGDAPGRRACGPCVVGAGSPHDPGHLPRPRARRDRRPLLHPAF